MFERIKTSIEDFLRGYSIQKNATEELVSRKRYFDDRERYFQGRSIPFALEICINSLNDIHRQIEKMGHTPFENYGRRFYCLLHRELWEEALSEMEMTK